MVGVGSGLNLKGRRGERREGSASTSTSTSTQWELDTCAPPSAALRGDSHRRAPCPARLKLHPVPIPFRSILGRPKSTAEPCVAHEPNKTLTPAQYSRRSASQSCRKSSSLKVSHIHPFKLGSNRRDPCLLPLQNPKFFKIFHHIESLDTYIELDENKN